METEYETSIRGAPPRANASAEERLAADSESRGTEPETALDAEVSSAATEAEDAGAEHDAFRRRRRSSPPTKKGPDWDEDKRSFAERVAAAREATQAQAHSRPHGNRRRGPSPPRRRRRRPSRPPSPRARFAGSTPAPSCARPSPGLRPRPNRNPSSRTRLTSKSRRMSRTPSRRRRRRRDDSPPCSTRMRWRRSTRRASAARRLARTRRRKNHPRSNRRSPPRRWRRRPRKRRPRRRGSRRRMRISRFPPNPNPTCPPLSTSVPNTRCPSRAPPRRPAGGTRTSGPPPRIPSPVGGAGDDGRTPRRDGARERTLRPRASYPRAGRLGGVLRRAHHRRARRRSRDSRRTSRRARRRRRNDTVDPSLRRPRIGIQRCVRREGSTRHRGRRDGRRSHHDARFRRVRSRAIRRYASGTREKRRGRERRRPLGFGIRIFRASARRSSASNASRSDRRGTIGVRA